MQKQKEYEPMTQPMTGANKCEACGQTFQTKEDLQKHNEEMHKKM